MGVQWHTLRLQCRKKWAPGLPIACGFHHCDRSLLSLLSPLAPKSQSPHRRAGLSYHSMTDFLKFSFWLLENTHTCFCFLPFQLLFLYPVFWFFFLLLEVYSSISCSCLLMMCFLETSYRIPVSSLCGEHPRVYSNYTSGLRFYLHLPSRHKRKSTVTW